MEPEFVRISRFLSSAIDGSPGLVDQNGNRIESDQEPEPRFDPLESIREQTRLRQRDIILKLQARLAQMVEAGQDIDDIHTCSHAIGMNLQIHDEITDIF